VDSHSGFTEAEMMTDSVVCAYCAGLLLLSGPGLARLGVTRWGRDEKGEDLGLAPIDGLAWASEDESGGSQ
jgi:hypothetical protein